MFKRIFLTVSLSLSVASTAISQDSALELFNQDTDVVLRLAEPDKSIENLVALVNGAQPGFGDLARSVVTQNLGKAISNPTLTGADQSRDWYVAMITNGQSEPTVVFAIPAVESADFVAALGDGFESSIHGKFVLYTDKGTLPAVPDSSSSFSSKLSEKSKAAFNSGNISLYVNADHLSKSYRDELNTAHDQVLEGLNQLRFAMPQDSGMNMGAIIDMYGTLAEGAFQGIRDADSLTVSVAFGEKGVRIEEYAEFGKNSKSAKLLAKHPTSDMADLSKLPKGAVAYYGLSGGMKETIKWGMDLSAGMSTDEDTLEKIQKVYAELDEVEFGATVGSFAIGNVEDGLFKVAGIANVKPMDKFKKYMQNSIESMSTLEMPGMTQTSTIDKDAETYGDHKADIVTITQTFDEDQPQAEMQQRMQQLFFGTKGMKSRVIYLEDKYLTVMGGGKEETQKALNSLNNPENSAIEKPRQILMEQANVIGLIDLAGGVANGLKAAAEIDEINLPIDSQMIDNLNLTPSFIGFGISIEGDSVRCRTDVPMAQIQGITKLSILYMSLQNQL